MMAVNEIERTIRSEHGRNWPCTQYLLDPSTFCNTVFQFAPLAGHRTHSHGTLCRPEGCNRRQRNGAGRELRALTTPSTCVLFACQLLHPCPQTNVSLR